MIPPDWMLKTDTITTQNERVQQAKKAYQQALHSVKEELDNQFLRADLEKAAKFLIDQEQKSYERERSKILGRKKLWDSNDWKVVNNPTGSTEEIEKVFAKREEWTKEDWQKLIGPEPHEEVARRLSHDFLKIGLEHLENEVAPKKSKLGRKEEFIQWKGTQEELILLLEILKDTDLIHYEQFPITKICGLFVNSNFQSLNTNSLKCRVSKVKENRQDLKEKKLKLINKINNMNN